MTATIQSSLVSTTTYKPVRVINANAEAEVIGNYAEINYSDGIAPSMYGMVVTDKKTGQESFQKLASTRPAALPVDHDYEPWLIHEMALSLGWKTRKVTVGPNYKNTHVVYAPTERVEIPTPFKWDKPFWDEMRKRSTDGVAELVAILDIPLIPGTIKLREAAYLQVCKNGLRGYNVFNEITLKALDVTPNALNEALQQFFTYAYPKAERQEQFTRAIQGEEIGYLEDVRRQEIISLFENIAELHLNEGRIPMSDFSYNMRKTLKAYNSKTGMGAPWFLKQLNRQMEILPEFVTYGDLENGVTNAINEAASLGNDVYTLHQNPEKVVDTITQLMDYKSWN